MAFILGVVFFAVVIGLIDARLPWPRPERNPRADSNVRPDRSSRP